jgi:hypothetical protein
MKEAAARKSTKELHREAARRQFSCMTEEERRVRSELISRRTKERMAELGCREHLSEVMSGRTHDEARRKLTSESVRRAYLENPKYRENLVRARVGGKPMLGKRHSEETKARMRASRFARLEKQRGESDHG